MKPVELTMKQVLVAARQAMNEGRLGKYSNPSLEGCRYRYHDGSCCVIGAAFSTEEAIRFGSISVDGLVEAGEVEVPADEIDDMRGLQLRHDNIIGGEFANQFLSVFEMLEAKYGAR